MNAIRVVQRRETAEGARQILFLLLLLSALRVQTSVRGATTTTTTTTTTTGSGSIVGELEAKLVSR